MALPNYHIWDTNLEPIIKKKKVWDVHQITSFLIYWLNWCIIILQMDKKLDTALTGLQLESITNLI